MMTFIMIQQRMPGSRPSVLQYSHQMLSLPCAAYMQTGESSKQQPYTALSLLRRDLNIDKRHHKSDTISRVSRSMPVNAISDRFYASTCLGQRKTHTPMSHWRSMLLTSAVAGIIQNQDGIVLQPSSRCILSCLSGTNTKTESVAAAW